MSADRPSRLYILIGLSLVLSIACIVLTTIVWVENSRNAEQIKRLQAAWNIHKLAASTWEYTRQGWDKR